MFCIVPNNVYLCVVNVSKGGKAQKITKAAKKTTSKKLIKLKVMKKQSNNLFTQISKEEVENLTQQVKETIATGLNGQGRNFGSLDLWNIHRQKRTLSGRRQFV